MGTSVVDSIRTSIMTCLRSKRTELIERAYGYWRRDARRRHTYDISGGKGCS
jgi:hypothetical protein